MQNVLLLPWPEGAYIGDVVLTALRDQAKSWAHIYAFDLCDTSEMPESCLRKAMHVAVPDCVLGVSTRSFLDALGIHQSMRSVELSLPTLGLSAAEDLRFRLVQSWMERGLTPLADLYFAQSLPQMEASMSAHLRAESWS